MPQQVLRIFWGGRGSCSMHTSLSTLGLLCHVGVL